MHHVTFLQNFVLIVTRWQPVWGHLKRYTILYAENLYFFWLIFCWTFLYAGFVSAEKAAFIHFICSSEIDNSPLKILQIGHFSICNCFSLLDEIVHVVLLMIGYVKIKVFNNLISEPSFFWILSIFLGNAKYFSAFKHSWFCQRQRWDSFCFDL